MLARFAKFALIAWAVLLTLWMLLTIAAAALADYAIDPQLAAKLNPAAIYMVIAGAVAFVASIVSRSFRGPRERQQQTEARQPLRWRNRAGVLVNTMLLAAIALVLTVLLGLIDGLCANAPGQGTAFLQDVAPVVVMLWLWIFLLIRSSLDRRRARLRTLQA